MENKSEIKAINSELMKKNVIALLHKLTIAIQIEKQCDKVTAEADVAYFLKQLIYVINGESNAK